MKITRNIFWLTTSILILVIGLVSACAVPKNKATLSPTTFLVSTPASVPASTPSSTTEALVSGSVTYLEKIALPTGSIVEVKLLDISKQDAPALTIGEQVISTSGQQVPVPFSIKYNPSFIDPRYTYAVRASITVDGKLWFTTDTKYGVITQGNPSTVELVLKNIAASLPSSGLENTIWMLQSYGPQENLKSVLPGSNITALFDSAKGQVGGTAGVNRYSGSYELKGNKVSITKPLASTMMAGPQPLMDQEKEYLTAIQTMESFQFKNGQLQVNCGQQILIFSKEAAQELSVDISSSGKEVTLAIGDTLTVTLDSNVTTGYSWNEIANLSNKALIQQKDHKYQPPGDPIPGAGGKEVWNFLTLKAGTSTVSMEYRRPWEPNTTPAKTFTLTITVK